MNLSDGAKTSEFVVVLALIAANIFGLDVDADSLQDIIAQAHGNSNLIYLGVAYVLGRSWVKGKKYDVQAKA